MILSRVSFLLVLPLVVAFTLKAQAAPSTPASSSLSDVADTDESSHILAETAHLLVNPNYGTPATVDAVKKFFKTADNIEIIRKRVLATKPASTETEFRIKGTSLRGDVYEDAGLLIVVDTLTCGDLGCGNSIKATYAPPKWRRTRNRVLFTPLLKSLATDHEENVMICSYLHPDSLNICCDDHSIDCDGAPAPSRTMRRIYAFVQRSKQSSEQRSQSD